MARGIAKLLMGIQDDGKDTYRRTLFRLAYGSDAVIPAKVGLTSYKVGNHDKGRNNEAMCLQLDLEDKVRATAEQRSA